MRFFDAHCDTVMKEFRAKPFDFIAGSDRSHLDLPRLEQAGVCLQLFAVFTARSHFPDVDLHAYADQAIAAIKGWSARSGGRLKMAYTAADIQSACAGGGLYGLLGIEGADCLGDSADELGHFVEAGVRNVIAAWTDNAFSGTVMGANGPLSSEGARLIEMCEAMHVMVDVSHLSDTAFWQVRDLTHRPFIASHSDCRALSPSPRNLPDDMIKALADRGGVMGINLAADFLEPEYLKAWDEIAVPGRAALRSGTLDAETATRLEREMNERWEAIPLPDMSWIARHVLHAIQVGGEDCIGLGGDLDGISFMPSPMTGVENYPAIPDVLHEAGLSDGQVEKVCWRNFARVFGEVLPAA